MFRLDPHRIARPEMNERGTQFSIFDQQLITSTCGIRPSSRAVENYRSLFFIRSVHRQTYRKWLVPRKITRLQSYRVIARKFYRCIPPSVGCLFISSTDCLKINHLNWLSAFYLEHFLEFLSPSTLRRVFRTVPLDLYQACF